MLLGGIFPKFLIFALHEGIQAVGESNRQSKCLDQLQNIGKIFKPARICHARRKFQFDELSEIDEVDAVEFNADVTWIRKCRLPSLKAHLGSRLRRSS